MQIVLQHLPELLCIRKEGATWLGDTSLVPGVAELKPQRVVWALDKKWQFKVERHGFAVASDLSGTAHSFVGANLNAAITDCGAWDDIPSRQKQLSGYMCGSRVEYAHNLCFTQPFCPTYFVQGDLPGPNLFLQFWKGLLTQKELSVAWVAETKKRRGPNEDWPNKMPLYCRGCSEAVNDEVYRPLKDFPTRTRVRSGHVSLHSAWNASARLVCKNV